MPTGDRHPWALRVYRASSPAQQKACGPSPRATPPVWFFGTGEHAMTRLRCEAICDALARPELRGCKLLNYGIGSGVLCCVSTWTQLDAVTQP